MADFRRLPRAITKAGQIKGAGGRHEKDDRRRVDDRSGYVLGWANERKINALLRRASVIQDQLNTLAATEKTLKDEAARASDRAQILAALTPDGRFHRDRLAAAGQPDRGPEGREKRPGGGIRRASAPGPRAKQGQGADQLGRGRAEKGHREHRGSGQQDRVGSFGPGNGPAGRSPSRNANWPAPASRESLT